MSTECDIVRLLSTFHSRAWELSLFALAFAVAIAIWSVGPDSSAATAILLIVAACLFAMPAWIAVVVYAPVPSRVLASAVVVTIAAAVQVIFIVRVGLTETLMLADSGRFAAILMPVCLLPIALCLSRQKPLMSLLVILSALLDISLWSFIIMLH